MSDLYDDDAVLWSERQADLLRRRARGELANDADLDWLNIAEEIDARGRSERSALASHIRIIIEHLTKLDASPATNPRASWQETVLRARADIEELLEASPSLKGSQDKVVEREHSRALRLAAAALATYGGTPRVPLDGLRYSTDQVLGPWLPGDAA
jgi:Domain of unknown function DUF29